MKRFKLISTSILLVLSSIACMSSGTESTTLASPAFQATSTSDGYRESVIAQEGAYPMSHGSTLVELGNGQLMACWFAGSSEAQRDVKIPCAWLPLDSLESDAVSWSQPRVAVHPGETVTGGWIENKFIGNPVLHLDPAGKLWLFYEAVQVGGHSGAYVDYKTSDDNGSNWSASMRLIGGITSLGHLPRNKARPLSAGRFILPVYREFSSHYGYTVIIDPTRLDRGESLIERTSVIPGSGHIQPSLVFQTASDGAQYLRAYLRKKGGGKVLTSVMRFNDHRWSAPTETNIPNPDAAVDAIETHTGGVLIAYNNSATTRTSMSLAYSRDGVQFTKIHDLVEDEAQETSYPAIIADSRGSYHVSFTADGRKTIRHVWFTKKWLEQKLAGAGLP